MSKLTDNTASLQALLEAANTLPEKQADPQKVVEDIVTGVLTEVEWSLSTMPQNAFRNWSITKINAPNLTSISDNAMYDCKSLVEVNFPELTALPGYNFYNCVALQVLNLPKVTEIKANVLYLCTSLEYVDLPKVNTIGGYVLRSCTNLNTLILRNATAATLTGTNTLVGSKIANGTGYIYVPAALVDTYKAATNWSVYADQFRAIEDYPEITGG